MLMRNDLTPFQREIGKIDTNVFMHNDLTPFQREVDPGRIDRFSCVMVHAAHFQRDDR